MLGLFAGAIGVVELASKIIFANLESVVYCAGYGMSFAVNKLVGSNLGENSPIKAQRYSYSSGICSLFISSIIMTFLIVFRNEVPLLYTKDTKVVDTVSSIMPIFSTMIMLD